MKWYQVMMRKKKLLDEVDMTKISTIEQELLLAFKGNIILLINFKIIHLLIAPKISTKEIVVCQLGKD